MPPQYNKPKKGRIHSGSGPRDLQRRGDSPTGTDSEQLIFLMSQVTSMTLEIAELKREGVKTSPATVVSGDKLYTESEFNEELIKALEKELRNPPLNTDIKLLESEVIHLKEIVVAKDDIIDTLKSTPLQEDITTILKVDSDRPVIAESVIDPTDVTTEIEPHISIKEIKGSNTSDKLSKLKNILGGPN